MIPIIYNQFCNSNKYEIDSVYYSTLYIKGEIKMTGPNYPEATNVSYPDAAKVPGIGHQIEMLERGIVTASSTDISLLGIDLLGP